MGFSEGVEMILYLEEIDLCLYVILLFTWPANSESLSHLAFPLQYRERVHSYIFALLDCLDKFFMRKMDSQHNDA
eukprot:scaffold2212_cov167-Ochromonas_danica.AAC.3